MDLQTTPPKPACQLTGTDGNVFMLAGRVGSTLKRAGLPWQAEEMYGRLLDAGSYDEALRIFMEYVEIV